MTELALQTNKSKETYSAESKETKDQTLGLTSQGCADTGANPSIPTGLAVVAGQSVPRAEPLQAIATAVSLPDRVKTGTRAGKAVRLGSWYHEPHKHIIEDTIHAPKIIQYFPGKTILDLTPEIIRGREDLPMPTRMCIVNQVKIMRKVYEAAIILQERERKANQATVPA